MPKPGRGLKSLLPHVSEECLQLILAMLIYDPDDRIASKDIMRHSFFKELVTADNTAPSTKIISSSKEAISQDSRAEVSHASWERD